VSRTASSELALHGGTPVRSRPFPPPPGVGAGERRAVSDVLDSGVLSEFVGEWVDAFWGGPRVRAMEAAWRERFDTRYAIAMNSATSALYAAVAAAGIGPGDEVIVSPYTMSASATCALVHGAVPVFADVEPETFGLDPASVRARITPRTKAIVVVDIFGCPARLDEIVSIAAEHGLVVIEDAAQAPGALYHGRAAGTLGHIGVFSLNYHKTIQCGEGGVAVTNDERLAERLALVRNHGEAVVGAMGAPHADLLGFNYRLGELEAAIATVQLGRLEELTEPRIKWADRISSALGELDGLTPPAVPNGVRHVYYVHVTRVDEDTLGVSRAAFAAGLRAEGIPVVEGYVAPLYRQPVYRQRAAPLGLGGVVYDDGICPVTERLHEHEVIYHSLIHAGMDGGDVQDVIDAFAKVYAHREEL